MVGFGNVTPPAWRQLEDPAERAAYRARIAATVKRLIDVLDALDGDPDLESTGDDEPSLCGTQASANSAAYPRLVDIEDARWSARL